MTREPASVVALDGTHAWVETAARSACSSCGASGCGSAVLGALGGTRTRRYRVRNQAGAQLGERVMVAVPDGALLRASLLGYLLPLLGLVAGTLLSAAAGDSDFQVALAGVLGMVLTALIARRLTARAVREYQPFIAGPDAVPARPVDFCP